MLGRLVAVDIETYDPSLHDTGDGSCRVPGSPDDDGSRLLVAGTFDGQHAEAYYPGTARWAEFMDMMADSSIDKVYHNGVYDLAWLYCRYGCEMKGLQHDTMTRMVYIDEYAKLDLDTCCARFHVQGKNKADTIEAWYEAHRQEVIDKARACGHPIKKNDSLWKHALFLWDTWPAFREQMVKYNLQDCRATWYLYQAQEPRMQQVMEPYLVDIKLTPHIIGMKKTGARIDRPFLSRLAETVHRDLDMKQRKLQDMYGVTPEMVNSSKQLGARMNEMGIHSPVLTKTGAESWGADAMARLMHNPVVPLVLEVKMYRKLLDTYLEKGMADCVLSDGRIHCTFSPNKREDGGTVTGRFACSKPNLQQIPARSKGYGDDYSQDMRAIFIPEDGCMLGAFDYSQIEYLLLAHYAVGQQAEWFRKQANDGVDFHTVAMKATGIPSRPVVKTFNYGVIYGMGWKTAMEKNYVLFEKLAAEKDEDIVTFTRDTYDSYHAKLPVIRETMAAVQEVSKVQGYVRTIAGRYQHKPKPQFDPATGKWNDFIYKMLNKLIQGSAADILKYAMYQAYSEGVFNVLKMHITVHDENVVSIPFNREGTEAAVRLKEIMDSSFKDKLRVPMKAAAEVGPNWGYWASDIWEAMKAGDFSPAYFKKDYKETH